ncbi:MAG: regulatory iron-sulfur-containing complex subunit RicT [bacterium]|nr:regulatory iron-sulfur-containing complex subunit RicT [bacterium]
MVEREHALHLAKQMAKDLGLTIKILEVKSVPQQDQLIFFFSSQERVDYRQLVNNLQDTLGVMVEMRLLGSRECAAKLGGVGVCGQPLCCARWLPQPLNVPTKILEKFDNISSPAQVAGACGKLLCCLLYEQDDFQMPKGEEKLENKPSAMSEGTAVSQSPASSVPSSWATKDKPPLSQPTVKQEKHKKKIRHLILPTK